MWLLHWKGLYDPLETYLKVSYLLYLHFKKAIAILNSSEEGD